MQQVKYGANEILPSADLQQQQDNTEAEFGLLWNYLVGVDAVVSGLTPSIPGTGLTANVSQGVGYKANGTKVVVPVAGASVSFSAADPSLPRIDAITLTPSKALSNQQQRNFKINGVVTPQLTYKTSSDSYTITAVAGTPTSGANLTNLSGAPTIPANALLIGYVLVDAGATNLTSGDLSDQRVMAATVFDAIPADASVTTGKLEDGAVTLAKMAPASVGLDQLTDLRCSAGAGLNLNYAAGTVMLAGVPTAVSAGTAAMNAGATNYVYLTSAGMVDVNTTGFPAQSAGAIPMAVVVTSGSAITSVTDKRGWLNATGLIPLSSLSDLGQDTANTTGLTYAYLGGNVRLGTTVTTVAAGTVILDNNTTNYVESDEAGAVSSNTTGFTAGSFPMAQVITSGGSISSVTDKRAWIGNGVSDADPRLNAAIGLKTATTVVSIQGATAPTAGQVLTAIDDETAEWQTPDTGGAVPVGAIILWKGNSCPSGYVRDDDFADLFPRGAPTSTDPGSTGGATTHTHTFSGTTGQPNEGATTAQPSSPYAAVQAHTHNYSGTTAAGSSLPPYRTVLFCRKT